MSTRLLVVEDLTKRFESITAIDGLSLSIPEGEVTAVIGPNGAGKTTLFNLLTGALVPTSGSISYRGERIDGLEPHEIVHRGIARSYQITNFFPDLTALENVRLAAQARHTGFGPRDFLAHHADVEEPIAEARAVLDRLGLLDVADRTAGNLSHGQQRHLEVGVALAADPNVLFMDEPTAGMSPDETAEMRELIGSLANDITIVIVEHDVALVMAVADRIAVMNRGALVTVDKPEAVTRNEKVQEAYLRGGSA